MKENKYAGCILAVKDIQTHLFSNVTINVKPGLYDPTGLSIYPIIPTTPNGTIEVVRDGQLYDLTLDKLSKYKDNVPLTAYLEDSGTEIDIRNFLNPTVDKDYEVIRARLMKYVIILYAVTTYSFREMDAIECSFNDLLTPTTIDELDHIDFIEIVIDKAYPDLIMFLNEARLKYPFNRVRVTLLNKIAYGEPVVAVVIVEHNALYDN